MLSKLNRKAMVKKLENRHTHYTLKKLSIGLVSAAVGATLMFAQGVQANAEESDDPSTEVVTTKEAVVAVEDNQENIESESAEVETSELDETDNQQSTVQKIQQVTEEVRNSTETLKVTQEKAEEYANLLSQLNRQANSQPTGENVNIHYNANVSVNVGGNVYVNGKPSSDLSELSHIYSNLINNLKRQVIAKAQQSSLSQTDVSLKVSVTVNVKGNVVITVNVDSNDVDLDLDVDDSNMSVDVVVNDNTSEVVDESDKEVDSDVDVEPVDDSTESPTPQPDQPVEVPEPFEDPDPVEDSRPVQDPVVDPVDDQDPDPEEDTEPEVVETNEVVPYETVYIANNDLDYDTSVVYQPGKTGVRSVTTVDGEEVSSEITTQPVNEIVHVGNIRRITEQLPFETIRVANDNLLIGEERTTQQGQNGLATNVYAYTVNPQTGELSDPEVVDTVTERPVVDQVIEFGTVEPLSEFQTRSLELLNNLRIEQGLNPLTYNSELIDAATIRSEEVSRLWAHARPDGRSWDTVFEEIDYTPWAWGENLAYHTDLYSEAKMAEEMFQDWLNSPGHYENMVTPWYQEVGIASYVADDGVRYAAQIFAQQ